MTEALRSVNKSGSVRGLSDAEANRRKSRAKEWRQFRLDFLYKQTDLAAALGISRRSVQYIENAKVKPSEEVDRKFKILYRKEHAKRATKEAVHG